MKTIEIIGYRRANLGKVESQRLRDEGLVPCVLYGGDNQVHFYAPMILFREVVYTNEAHFVHLNIEGEESQAILQEVQFHPVSEVILHADFLRISEDRKIKMSIPARLVGQAPGVNKGGALVQKRSALKVYGFPKDMPDHIDVDVSTLDCEPSPQRCQHRRFVLGHGLCRNRLVLLCYHKRLSAAQTAHHNAGDSLGAAIGNSYLPAQSRKRRRFSVSPYACAPQRSFRTGEPLYSIWTSGIIDVDHLVSDTSSADCAYARPLDVVRFSRSRGMDNRFYV